MIGAINSVSFGDAQDLINSPGRFTTVAPTPEMKPDSFEMEGEKKKSHTGLKVLLGAAIVALAAFIGLGVAVKKGNLKNVPVPAEGFFAKAKAQVQNFGVKVGEAADKCYTTVAGWFGKGKKATEETAKNVAENA